MPDKNNEEVKYKFTADVDSLVQGAVKVLNTLDKIEEKFKQVDKSTEKRSFSTGINKAEVAMKKLSATMQKAFSQKSSSGLSKQLKTMIIDAQVASQMFQNEFKRMLRVFDPITSKITAMKAAMDNAIGKMTPRLGSLASAFRRVSKAADEEGTSADENKQKNDKNSKSLKNLQKQLDKLASSFDKTSNSSNKMSNAFGILSNRSAALKSAFAAIVGYKLGDFFATGIRDAVNYAEVLNMFNVAMRDSIDAGEEFVNQMSEIYSLDPKTIMQHTAMFYQLASAVETPAAAAEQMSKGLTQLAVDLASVFDMDINQVADNLSSGIQGMSRAVRKYGIDIRATTLQQEALNLGLDINIGETSEANRQGLRYLVMMKQAAIVTGDFGKTLSSPANQLRILKEQVGQLARAIGSFFLPVLQTVLPYLNGFIMAIRTIINFLASLLGIVVPSFGGATDAAKDLSNAASGAASGVGGIGDSAKKATKDMKNLLAPFDELNVLKEDTDLGDVGGGGGGGGGIGGDLMDPAIAAAIEDMERKLGDVENKANDVRDAILDFLGFDYQEVFNPDTGEYEQQLVWLSEKFHDNLVAKFPQWKKSIDAIFTNWDAIIDSVVRLGTVLWDTFGVILAPLRTLWETLWSSVDWDQALADFITALPDRLNAISDWIEQHQTALAVLSYAVTAIALAFKGWMVIQTLMPILTAIGTVFSTLATFINPVTIAIAAVSAALIYAYTQFQSVRDSVSELMSVFGNFAATVGNLIKTLWEKVLEPIFTRLGELLTELWQKHIKNLIEQFALLVTEIGIAVGHILNFLGKIATFLIQTLGPTFTAIFNGISAIVTTVIGIIADLIASLLEVLRGLITFLTGVFTLDWEKAWTGIKTFLKGIWDAIWSIIKGAINLIIDGINGLVDAVWSALASIANGVLSIGDKILSFIGIDVDFRLPDHPPKIPHLATGGVVTGPTMAMIGEGKYNEAVIPLDNSPQMQQLVREIVDAMKDDPRGGGGINLNQRIELDGKVIYRNQQKVARNTGYDFGMGDFQR